MAVPGQLSREFQESELAPSRRMPGLIEKLPPISPLRERITLTESATVASTRRLEPKGFKPMLNRLRSSFGRSYVGQVMTPWDAQPVPCNCRLKLKGLRVSAGASGTTSLSNIAEANVSPARGVLL